MAAVTPPGAVAPPGGETPPDLVTPPDAATSAGPVTPPDGPAAADAPAPGPLALYAAIGDAVAERLPRRLWPVIVEGLFIAAYCILRTVDAPREAQAAWVAAAAILSLVSPGSGLTVFAVMAIFSEPFVLTRDLGAKPIVAAGIGVGVALRLARRPRDFPWSLPIGLGMILAAGTLVGVGIAGLRAGDTEARAAFVDWIAGPATLAIVIVTAAWAARRGSLRPLVAVTVAGIVAGAVSLSDFLDAASIRGTPLNWMVRPTRLETRLSGVISSPNGTAALLIGPFAVCAAAAVLGRRIPLIVRAAAAAAVVILSVALYLTYSRAALIGIFLVTVVLAWRIRRWLGAGLLAVGIVAGAVLLPSYLATRSTAVGGGGEVDPSGVLVASDVLRLRAWAAASAMWADNPVVGVGFGQYGVHADAYGDAVLNSPHNEWLRFFAEEGTLVGLIGAGWIAATLLALARAPGWVGAGTLAGALGWSVAATFNNPLLFIQVSTVVATIVGTGLARASGRSAESGAGAPAGADPSGTDAEGSALTR